MLSSLFDGAYKTSFAANKSSRSSDNREFTQSGPLLYAQSQKTVK